MAQRLAPTKQTLSQLFALSGNQCAFPGCTQRLFSQKNKFIAQVCHIAAASDGGERPNVNLTPEEKRQPENLLMLCYPHHIETDDVDEYTVEKLKEMKKNHEDKFRGVINLDDYPTSIVDDMFNVEMRRMQEQITETLDNTKQLLTNDASQAIVNEEVLNSLANVAARLNAITGTNPTNFSAEIDSIMELRASKQQESAFVALERLKNNDWGSMTPHERYRVLANMGIICLELDQQQKAGDFFIEAIAHENITIKSLGIGALGYILKENRGLAEDCIKRAWAIEPLNTDSWYAFIMLNKETIPYHDLVAKIPEEVKKDVEVANGLAQAAAANKLYSEANKWAQVALDNSATNRFDNKAVLATSILQSQINPYEVLTEQVSENAKIKIKYVIELFTEAWEEIKHTPLAKSRAWWLINRGVAHKFFPNKEAAYQDMLESCQHNETYESLRHLAIAALDADRIARAIEAAEKMIRIGGAEKLDEAELFRIELISKKGDHADAKILLENYIQRDLTDANRYHASLRLEATYQALNNFDAAISLNAETLNKFPQKIKPYINKGKYSGNIDELKSELTKALGVVDEDTDANEIYDLVHWMQRIGDFVSAQSLMERITNTNALSDHTRELLEIYYKSGETAKLLDLTEQLLDTYGPVDFLTEYKVIVYQKIGDYEQAINTCLEYLVIYPGDQLIMIRLGILYDRAGRPDDLKNLLATVNHSDPNLPFDLQENLALLFFAIGDYQTYYKILYEIRRQFFDNPKVHQNFVSRMLKRKILPDTSAEQVNTETVQPEFAVTVKIGESQYETFIIEDRKDTKLLNSELHLADPIAKVLLNKRLRDNVEVELPSGINKLEIVDIKTKYAYAVAESLKLLTGRFLQTSDVKKFQVGNSGNPAEDLKPMMELFTGAEELHQNLSFYFRRGMFTVGFIATTTDRPVIDVWRQYIVDEQLGLISQTFYPEEQRAFEAIKAGTPIIFDAVSLISSSLTDAFKEIEALPNQKIVTQSTFEEITEHIRHLHQNKETGIVHLKSDKGQMLNSFESPEVIQTQITNFQFLSDWIKSNCEIVPVIAAIKINARQKQEMDEEVGESFIDSMLTAEEYSGLLIAEEKLVRAYASQNFNVAGGNLYTLISYLKVQKIITEERSQDLSLGLIGLNYKFIPVDAGLLYNIVKSNDFQVDDLFVKSSFGIHSSLVLGDLALKITVDFFYKLYTETSGIITTLSAIRMEQIVSHMLNVLKQKFREAPMKARLLDLLQAKFRLLPFQFDELKTIINNN